MNDRSGWLEISTSGFASFNQARLPGHLVKELVQNSFDANGSGRGSVALNYWMENGDFIVDCRDDGSGMEDLTAIRVVYLTFKKDSHTKRGRFGRGFKEILSVARWARVQSGASALIFYVEDGLQKTRTEDVAEPTRGTHVRMALPWGAETIPDFDVYFAGFLVPPMITFTINGRSIAHRSPRHTITASLTTEIYNADAHSWRKPKRETQIEIVGIASGEAPFIYEMGIPVAAAEWTLPFHANIQQRVPMNPNRDALAAGYVKSVHTAALPTLLPEIEGEAATADWIGAAGMACDADTQRTILNKAFGDNAVRAVPTMGKRDFNHDAQRIGAAVVSTGQMSGGFRDMAKAHMPSAKVAIEVFQKQRAEAVAETSFAVLPVVPEAIQEDPRVKWIVQRGGSEYVQRCLDFAVWFCQQLVNSTNDMQQPVTGALAIGSHGAFAGAEHSFSPFIAHWNGDNRLTLALDVDFIWTAPLGARSLALYVHEAAHARNAHHGKGFHEEVERLSGVAASIMFRQGGKVQQTWPDLAMRGSD